MTDADSIRTEEEIDEQVKALWTAVEKMGDTDFERLEELIILCVQERLHEQIIATITERTQKVVGVSKAEVPCRVRERPKGFSPAIPE